MDAEDYTLIDFSEEIKNYLFAKIELKPHKLKIVKAQESLLFMMAYPQSAATKRLAEIKLRELTKQVKSFSRKWKAQYVNSGMPFTEMKVQFTHDFLVWLKNHDGCKVILDTAPDEMPDLNPLLYATLTSAERSETSAGLDNASLLSLLGVKPSDTLQFLLNEFSRLNAMPLVKDYMFDSLSLFCTLHPVKKEFSLAYNRFLSQPVFFHDSLLKKFDHELLVSRKLPAPKKLAAPERKKLVDTIKKSMALTNRETDTVTYMDENSLRYVELERGISIAVYGMTPDRQLPFESYIGYTLFKNGYPCAYGGSWVFGKRALFGINIFDWFRGGESGYIFCQLLRTYHQWFGVDYFEVEPYQYGQDNPDGIRTGAFWFYYRYGFRPVNTSLQALAKKEAEKIAADKTYRSPEKILHRFTESNIAWTIKPVSHIRIENLTTSISCFIQKKFKGNRMEAEEESVLLFGKSLNKKFKQITPSLIESALWAGAYNITELVHLRLLYQMSKSKPITPYRYQQLLAELLQDLGA